MIRKSQRPTPPAPKGEGRGRGQGSPHTFRTAGEHGRSPRPRPCPSSLGPFSNAVRRTPGTGSPACPPQREALTRPLAPAHQRLPGLLRGPAPPPGSTPAQTVLTAAKTENIPRRPATSQSPASSPETGLPRPSDRPRRVGLAPRRSRHGTRPAPAGPCVRAHVSHGGLVKTRVLTRQVWGGA